VCRQYLRKKNRKNELSFHFTQIGRWWNKTDEIDVVAMDAAREHFLIGECKYKNSLFPVSEFKRLQEKAYSLDIHVEKEFWIFSKNGFTTELNALAKEQGVYAVDLQEIVEG